KYARNRVKTPVPESLRVPEPCRSAQGQSVPKSRPRGVDDGKRVNIPVPTVGRYESEEGRRSKVTGGGWAFRWQGGGGSPPVNPRERRIADAEGAEVPQRVADACCQEKLRGPGLQLTVP